MLLKCIQVFVDLLLEVAERASTCVSACEVTLNCSLLTCWFSAIFLLSDCGS